MSDIRGEALRWLEDMQACCDGDHGEYWQDRFMIALDADSAGLGDGTWQEWRDLRLAEASTP